MHKKIGTRATAFLLSVILAFSLAMPTFADENEDDEWEAQFEWIEAEDWVEIEYKYTCEVTFTYIGEDEEPEQKEYGPYECEVTSKIDPEPECESDGIITYTASYTFELNDKEYMDTKEEAVSALGHEWGEPEFIWAEDGSSVGAEFVCERCNATLYVDGKVTGSITTKEPWCETNGIETYYGLIEVEFGEHTYYTEHEVVLPALGHNWDENQCTIHYDEVGHWEISTIMESRYICGVCGWYQEDLSYVSYDGEDLDYLVWVHQVEEHGKNSNYSSYVVDVGATGEWVVDSLAYDETVTDWSTTYCARCNQKYDHEHEYEAPIFIWNEDGTELEAMFVCSLGDDVQIVQGIVTSYEPYIAGYQPKANFDQPREVTCTKDGQMLSEGYVIFNGETYYDNCESIIPALGHDYSNVDYITENGVEYIIFTCSRCGDVQQISTDSLNIETKDPTCTEDGYTLYTGTVDVGGTTTTVAIEVPIPALGHSWGDPIPVWSQVYAVRGGYSFEAYRVCNRCNEIEYGINTSIEIETKIEATCTENGLNIYHGYVTFDNVVWDSDINVSTPVLGHDLGDWYTVTEATNTEDGLERRDCSRCDYYEIQVIPAYGHNYELVGFNWASDNSSCTATFECTDDDCDETITINCDISITEVPADCYNYGEITYIAICSLSGQTYFSDPIVVTTPMTTHEYTNPDFAWSDNYNECTAVFVCIHCGDVLATLDCSVESETIQEVSCTHDGIIMHYATIEYSNETYETSISETIEQVPHTIVSEEGYLATCTEDGLTEKEFCAVCGQVFIEQEVIPALGHNMDLWYTTKDPTCTETGTERRDCSRCDYYETENISALGHNWVNQTVIKEPTCTSEGTMEETCSRCGTTETESIPMIAHTYGEPTFEWSTDMTECTAIFECEVCGHIEEIECKVVENIVAPTCEKDGEIAYVATCELDGESYSDVKMTVVLATGHEYGEPTFSWSGNNSECVATFTCLSCGDTVTVDCTISSNIAKEATCTEEGSETFTAIATFDGKDYVGTKSETVPALGHEWGEWKVIIEATETEEGSEVRYCSRCGAEETQIIPKLEIKTDDKGTEQGTDENNDNGENTNDETDSSSDEGSNNGTVVTTDSSNGSNDGTSTITTTEVTTNDATNNGGSTNVESPKTSDSMWVMYSFIGVAFIACVGIVISEKKKEN